MALWSKRAATLAAVFATGVGAVVYSGKVPLLSQQHHTDLKQLVISEDELADKDGMEGRPLWVSFKDQVYDVTPFLQAHPGGEAHLLLAAGSKIDPFWEYWSQHLGGGVALKTLQQYHVGALAPEDEERGVVSFDVWKDEPMRVLRGVVGLVPLSGDTGNGVDGPFEAESTLPWLFHTPNEAFYVRNHAPVPEDAPHTLSVGLPGQPVVSYSLGELKQSFEAKTLEVTLQCAGNRLIEAGDALVAAKLPNRWAGEHCDKGLLSHAQWKGVPVSAVLDHLKVHEHVSPTAAQATGQDAWCLEMQARDGYSNAIPLKHALEAQNEVLLAYEMNGVPLPRDHGAPLRVLVPGVVGSRNVKWVSELNVKKCSACTSPWYRNFYLEEQKPVMQWPIQGLITRVQRGPSTTEVGGFAYCGGGKTVAKVEVSVDRGVTWQTAEVERKTNSRWAWLQWKSSVPTAGGEVWCRATDSTGQSQPLDPVQAVAAHPSGYLYNAVHKVTL